MRLALTTLGDFWLSGEVEYTHESIRRMVQREVSEENTGEAIMNGQLLKSALTAIHTPVARYEGGRQAGLPV
ncbi:hypothetical protein HRbin17_02644 [bacterium HR17]|jgi:hypothetical protein|uniref:Uncharacterized protein n=1 Tax=Candidatus Fervidibacter japonicus TaxID=2035412 RepID=A0A2H5XG25_9BACT|nr:hypothetical protein HRbin17_02644 [bacterium HR17]